MLVRRDAVPGRPTYDVVKRAVDAVGSVLALLSLSPLIAGVAAVIALKLGRPVLYVQERPGKNGIPFRLIKFRSMRAVDDARGVVADDQRLDAFGRALRATSLDELPELWNVLRGEMSFVGPRPLLVGYLDRYNPRQARRHEVRPGITGLAQVSGRNSLDWSTRLELDVQYVDARSARLDAVIIARTVMAVLQREGTNAQGHATMPEFMGDSWTGS
jgi:lipopolysaccharide/colanic/teichoic acid biosynthesis glycosyltransferase